MKHLKMLGLAAIAALSLMAFVGAGTASATTLSTDAAGTTKYAAGTVIHKTLKRGTSATIETTAGSVIGTGTEATLKWTVNTATGTQVSGSIAALTFGGTSQTTDTLSTGSLSITKGAGDTGTVSGSGTQVTLEIFGVSCVYGTGEGTTLGTITGGTEPELAVSAALPKISGGFLCPGWSVWTTQWAITSPHALHFVS